MADSLTTSHKVCIALHTAYVEQQLDKVTKPVSDMIPWANILTFADLPTQKPSTNKEQDSQAKHDPRHTTVPFPSVQA